MPTCPRCNGEGFKMVDEGGGPVKDSCYHCAETGQISAAEARADRVQGLISALASILCARAENDSHDNPEGEDWVFHAAESMCSLDAYRYGQLMRFELEVAEHIQALDKANPDIVDALIDLMPS